MSGYHARYDAALQFAARAHRLQLRKGTDIPYIAHVVHVAAIIERHGFSDNVVIAGLLHDVVEDCDVPISAIAAQFGAAVAQIVAAVSEEKTSDGQPLPWETRKQANLVHLRTGGPEVAALKAADALHNIHSTIDDVRSAGPTVWQRFKASPQQTLWYYAEILKAVHIWLAAHPIVLELETEVQTLAQLVSMEN